MTASVRYVSTASPSYSVYDRGTDRWLGDVLCDREAREWFAYVAPRGKFLGCAPTRAAATDLILNATGGQS